MGAGEAAEAVEGSEMQRHWPNRRSMTDSLELAQLRERAAPTYEGYNLTPERLAHYAADNGIKITDFGGHSARWIKRFKAALCACS